MREREAIGDDRRAGAERAVYALLAEQLQYYRARAPEYETYRAVKVPHSATGLEERLMRIGWGVRVRTTSGPFFWGTGVQSLVDARTGG